MELGDVLRLALVIGAVFLFGFTLMELARRKLTEPVSLGWGFLSLILLLAGILIRPTQLGRMISLPGLILIILIVVVSIASIYFLSVQVSILARKNQELAMHISLLNNENEQILDRLSKLEAKESQDEEKDSVCD